MKTSAVLRTEARAAIRGGWFFRILFVTVCLQGLANGVSRLLMYLNGQKGIVTWTEYWGKRLEALDAGLDYALPTREAYTQMHIASSFELLLAVLFGAIALFGITVVTLRAFKDERSGWLGESFGGFRRPIGLALLMFVQNLVVGFWMLFLIIPGIIAAYRYRLVWYLACEHTDWGIMKCLGESARLMKGQKFRAFRLDLSYFIRLLPLCLIYSVGTVLVRLENPVGFMFGELLQMIFVFSLVYMVVWFIAGRTAFYRDVMALQPQEPAHDQSGND